MDDDPSPWSSRPYRLPADDRFFSFLRRCSHDSRSEKMETSEDNGHPSAKRLRVVSKENQDIDRDASVYPIFFLSS